MTEVLDPKFIATTLRERLQTGQLKLPLLPSVAHEVLGLVDDPDADAASIAELIQRDQALAAHFLRVVNSPLYAPVEPVVSLSQAVSRLGLGGTRGIVLAVAVKSSVFSASSREEDLARAWKRSMYGSRMAQAIARVCRTNAESAFLCGLLHDVGTPIVIQSLIDVCRENQAKVEDSLVDVTCALLHAEVGAALANSWKLPDFVGAAALHHENPEAANEHGELVLITALADGFARWIMEGLAETPPAEVELAERIGLSEAELAQLVEYATELASEPNS